MLRDLSPEEIAFGMVEGEKYIIKSRYGTYEDIAEFYGYGLARPNNTIIGIGGRMVYDLTSDRYGSGFIKNGAYRVLVDD
jgi:hypothetical protein